MFSLRTLLSLALLCIMIAGPVFLPLAPVQAATANQDPEQKVLSKARQALEQIGRAETAYDQLDLAEMGLAKLKPLLKSQPKHVQALLLRGRLYLAMAAANGELGASAINYWEYVSQEVDPWNFKARDDFSQLIKLKAPLMAEAYFYRAKTFEEEDDRTAADLKQACQLGYQPACAN